MRYLLIVTLLIAACKPDPSPPMAATVALAAVPAPADEGEGEEPTVSPPPVVVSGTPVAVSAFETLHENGEFVVWRQVWQFGATRGLAWLVRVPRTAPAAVVHSDDVVPFADLLPDDDGPWAAINGGFYEAENSGYRPMGLVISDGTVGSELTRRGGSGVFYVDERGPHIVHRSGFSAAPEHALQSIDRLVDRGTSVVNQRPGQSEAMRSAVAISADHLWIVALAADADIAVVPGGVRLSRSGAGLPLWAFAEYVLAATGATEALNLDGGVSTQIAVRDGDYALHVEGVRGTINAVVLRGPGIASPPAKR